MADPDNEHRPGASGEAHRTLVRSMRVEDCGGAAVLAGQLGYPATQAQIESRFLAFARDPDSALFVAEQEGGSVVGWVHVHGHHVLESEPGAEVSGLVVDSAHQRRGIGRALLAAAEGWAAEHGYRSVSLRSNVVRTKAHAFYKRVGYEVVKSQLKLRKELG